MGCFKKKKDGAQATPPPKPRRKDRNPCRAGVCRCCWYCGHCLLPFFWIYAMGVLGLSMYYGIMYTLEVAELDQEDHVHYLFWGTMTYAFIFVMVIQLTYLFILFESIRKFGRLLVEVLFAATFLLCLLIIFFSVYCNMYCPRGTNELRGFYGRQGQPVPSWIVEIIERIDRLRILSAVCALFIVFTLHIYLYNILKFLEEKKLRDMRESRGTENAPATATKDNPQGPAPEEFLQPTTASRKRSDIKIYYFDV